jgi:hypothetical protein
MLTAGMSYMSPALLRIIKYIWLMFFCISKIFFFFYIPHTCQQGYALYAHHSLRNHGLDGCCDFVCSAHRVLTMDE